MVITRSASPKKTYEYNVTHYTSPCKISITVTSNYRITNPSDVIKIKINIEEEKLSVREENV